MAIDLNKQETIKRMQGSPRLKTKLFLNPISGADKNELSRFDEIRKKAGILRHDH